jgi:hypothetical protein
VDTEAAVVQECDTMQEDDILTCLGQWLTEVLIRMRERQSCSLQPCKTSISQGTADSNDQNTLITGVLMLRKDTEKSRHNAKQAFHHTGVCDPFIQIICLFRAM